MRRWLSSGDLSVVTFCARTDDVRMINDQHRFPGRCRMTRIAHLRAGNMIGWFGNHERQYTVAGIAAASDFVVIDLHRWRKGNGVMTRIADISGWRVC